MTFPKLPTITRQLPPRQLASFPHTGILGLLTSAWLWWLRRHLNRDRYKLTLRGRKAKNPSRFMQSIPLSDARRVGLYVDDKMESKLDEYHRAWGRHDYKTLADHEKALLMDKIKNQGEVITALSVEVSEAGADVQILAASRDSAEGDFQAMARKYRNLRDTLHGERCEHCGERIRGLVEQVAGKVTEPSPHSLEDGKRVLEPDGYPEGMGTGPQGLQHEGGTA